MEFCCKKGMKSSEDANPLGIWSQKNEVVLVPVMEKVLL